MKYQDCAAKGVIEPSKLPPSEDALYFHCLRVYFQISVWRKLDQSALNPSEWGWKLLNGILEPITTEKECAPSKLLQFVRCKCKSGCTSNICSCKKHGLQCVPSCKNCHGTCQNGEVSICNKHLVVVYLLF